MSVRLKTIVFVVASLSIGLLCIYLLSWLVLTPSYTDLESRSVHTNVERGIGALAERLDTLDATNHDWAAWDDTYEFVQTASPVYVESNLADSTFAYMGIHVMTFVNAEGVVVYAKAMDSAFEREVDMPEDLLPHISSGSLFLIHNDVESAFNGILGLARGPMLVSARPIVTSAEEGPIQGTLIVGTYIDEPLVTDLASTTRLALAVDPTGVSNPLQAAANGTPGTLAGDIVVTPLDSTTVEGNTFLSDVYGQPVAQLTVTQDRSIYAEGQNALRYFLGVIAIGAIVLALLFVALLDRTMLRRISRLASQVRDYGQTEDFAGRVSVTGDDEIANLAGVINETFSALCQSHAQLAATHHDLEQTTAELKGTEQELRTTANQLRRLTRHLQTMREDERSLVANEIHDQVGQGLAALKMDLSTLVRATARGEAPTPAFLQRMTELLDTLLDTVRRLSSGLRPSMIEDLGLAEAIEWHLGDFGKGRAVRTTLRTQGPVGNVETSRALCIFRILQEALLVSADDSSVTEVTVTLTIENRYVLVAVQDNGRAVFDREALSRRELGLSLIRERANVFGGGVTITSTPETGTIVVAQVPT